MKNDQNSLAIFEEFNIRRHYDERLKKEGSEVVTNCDRLKLLNDQKI